MSTSTIKPGDRIELTDNIDDPHGNYWPVGLQGTVLEVTDHSEYPIFARMDEPLTNDDDDCVIETMDFTFNEVEVVKVAGTSAGQITKGKGLLGTIYDRLRKRSWRNRIQYMDTQAFIDEVRPAGTIYWDRVNQRIQNVVEHDAYLRGVRDALQAVDEDVLPKFERVER